MKAAVFTRAGAPQDVLELRDVTEPAPRAGEVVIDVKARPIHPSDLAFVRGTYRIRPVFPQIAGLSGVGRVLAGDSSVGSAVGSRVAFRWPGAWAERVAVPVDRTIALPDDISDDDGAQLPLNPVTAWGLLDMANVKPGDWVGLTAPTSSVARLVAALAGMRGIHSLPIESAEPSIADKVRSLTEGRGLSALLDSVGGPLMEALFGVMESGGTIVAYGALSNESITLRNGTLIYSNLTWRGFGIDRWLAGVTPDARAQMLEGLYEAVRGGRIPMPVRARFGLVDLHRAIQSAEERVAGKVLLQ